MAIRTVQYVPMKKVTFDPTKKDTEFNPDMVNKDSPNLIVAYTKPGRVDRVLYRYRRCYVHYRRPKHTS